MSIRWIVGVLAMMMAACGGGMSGTSPDAPPPDPVVRRPLPADITTRKAICYSGYRAGQSPDAGVYPEPAQIEEDLRLLVRGGWGLLRLFDAGTHAERVLAVIDEQQLDLKVMLGIWIAGPGAGHDAANRDQIARAVALVNAHPGVVIAVSVGNETLDDWSNVKVAPAELAALIRDVRGQIELPVTTDDSWLPFGLGMDGTTDYAGVVEVAAAVDFLSLHVYAISDAFYKSWEWKQEAVPAAQRAVAMMDAAMAYTRGSLSEIRTTLAAHDLDPPIVIGEGGWKSRSSATADSPPEVDIQRYLAHPVNQKLFYDRLMAWTYGDARDDSSPLATFTFEAFDEPWKAEWGDDDWGLFDADRKAKYVLWERFPELKPEGAPAYTDADAVYFSP